MMGNAKVVKGPGENVLIYIPASVRKNLKLKPGMRVDFDMHLASSEIEPPRENAFRKKARPTAPAQPAPTKQVVQ